MGKDGPTRLVRVHVAAFGKHPGWDDHIEEIGLDCDALIRAKRVLYSEGIAGNIDAGSWERLEEDQRLPGFKHAFYWRLPEGLLVGRMWASKDGKGRTKYPMCVCALVEGMPPDWAISTIMPLLEQIEAKVTQTNAAELVRLAIGETRRALEEKAAVAFAGGAGSDTGAEAALLGRLLAESSLTGATSTGSGLARILYEIEREMTAFRPTSGTMRMSRAAADAPAAQHIRVPRGLAEGGEGVLAWLSLLSQELSDAAPVLIFEALGHRHLDIIVGDPKPPQLFCTRATPKGLALTTDVPYTIDATFAGSVDSRLADWKQGKIRKAKSAGKSGGTGGGSASSESSRGNKKMLFIGLGAAALVAVIILLVVSSGGDDKGGTNDTPGPKTTNGTKNPEPRIAPKPPPSTITDSGSGDPRAGWGFEALVTRTKDLLASLEKEASEEGRTVDAGMRQRVDRAADKEAKFIRTATFTPAGRERLLSDMRGVEDEVATVAGEAEALLAETHARIRHYVEDAASNPKVTSAPMKAAWVAGMRGIDPSKGWKAARERVASLSKSLVEAEGGLSALNAGEIPTLTEANMGAVAQAFEGRREAAVRAAADGVVAGDPAKTEEARAALQSWASGARELLGKAGTIETMFARGLKNDEAGEGGATIASTIAGVKAMPAWKDFSVALGPLAQRCEALARLNDERDTTKLLAAIREAKGETSRAKASEVVTAWTNLAGSGWPKNADELGVAAKTLTDDVRSVLQRVGDTSRRDALLAGANQLGTGMWSAWAGANMADEATIKAGLDTSAALGAGEAQLAALPTWVRYNLARHAFAKALADAATKTGAARDAAQRAAMDDFVTKAKALDVTASGAPAALIAALEALRTQRAELDLAKLGPGAAGWTMEESAGGDSVVYTLTHEGATQRVEFRRIEPATGDEVSFLATTEVSVGQFAAAIGKAERWADFLKPLPSSDAGGVDPRKGPRTWVWSNGKVVPAPVETGDTSAGWLRVSPSMAGKTYYPESVKVEPPTWDSPMQQLSFRAAALMAKLAGCRLPTPTEWTTAHGTSGGWANRRDATWKKVFDHVKALGASDPEYPGANVFRPTRPGTRVIPMMDGDQAVEGEDGVLWFTGVNGGESQGHFRHLVGNVGEFVFEDATAMDAVPSAMADIEKLISRSEKLKIIGASALSPAEMKPDEAQPLTGSLIGGWWSDVGFRLAFSAPREAGAAGAGERMKTALAANGYLNGGK